MTHQAPSFVGVSSFHVISRVISQAMLKRSMCRQATVEHPSLRRQFLPDRSTYIGNLTCPPLPAEKTNNLRNSRLHMPYSPSSICFCRICVRISAGLAIVVTITHSDTQSGVGGQGMSAAHSQNWWDRRMRRGRLSSRLNFAHSARQI